jgi:uncharacterized damage-inducible protein DinB
MSQTTATPVSTPTSLAPPNAKRQYADVYAKEHQTTLKVLRAFPQDQAQYQPHPRSSTALKLAWTFVVENNIALASLRGPLNLGGGFPPPPTTFAECIAAYEASAKELLATLDATPDTRLSETVQFPSGKNQIADYPVGEFLWFMLLDSIHHRGQLSVYLRCAGGLVPSIYGPSADEPWR